MADFFRADLRGSWFERVDLSGAQFRTVDLSDAQFRAVYLKGAVMRGVELVEVDIHGAIENVTINGVEIGPLVSAELDRRYPDRAKMRPTDPAGFREAWDVVERLWDGTVARARRLHPSCCTSRSAASGRLSPDRRVTGRPDRTGRRDRLAGVPQLPGA
jgi:hypothetical protein